MKEGMLTLIVSVRNVEVKCLCFALLFIFNLSPYHAGRGETVVEQSRWECSSTENNRDGSAAENRYMFN